MVQLKPHRPHRQQQVLLAACTTSSPQPAATAPSVRPYAGVSAEVLFGLRAETRYTGFAAARALLAMPMFDPAESPKPIEALIDESKTVMRNRNIAFVDDLAEDRRLSDARLTVLGAAVWIDEAAGFALAEDMQAIADAVAARPELRHDTALLMALAPVVAQLKGLVA